MITSDHGEEFKDHGLLHHSHTLFDELLQVPLIVYLPGDVETGNPVTSQVSSVDIMPTILDFLGIDAPQTMEGITLLPCMEANDCPSRAAYSSTTRLKPLMASVRTNDFKYIISDGFNGRDEFLFHLKKDSAEKVNMSDGNTGLTGKYQKILFSNRDITLQNQLCLRIAINVGEHLIQGKIRTSGQFLYLESLGYWGKNTIALNPSKNEMVFNYIKQPLIAFWGEKELGINFTVAPSNETISFTDWTIDGNPAIIKGYHKMSRSNPELSSIKFNDLLEGLPHDPDPMPINGASIFLFKTSAMIPQKTISTGIAREHKNISQEDIEKLKALGYIQ